MTARRPLPPEPRPSARRSWVLTDDGVIVPIAVEIAASGSCPVALTLAERQLATERVLARGGTLSLISRHRKLQNHRAGEHDPWSRPLDDTIVLILSIWTYAGTGYTATSDAELALAAAARARARDQGEHAA